MNSGIYKIHSIKFPYRFYIGSAINLTNRRRAHFNLLNRSIHYNTILQNHFNKYHDLEFYIIELVEAKENLIKREQYYLDLFNPLFNISKTAGSPLGIKHSEEVRKKRSIALMGNKNSLGVKPSIETRKLLSNLRMGNKNRLGKKPNITLFQRELARKRQSKLILDLSTGIYYDSALELCNILHCRVTTLRAKLNGQNKNDTQYIYA